MEEFRKKAMVETQKAIATELESIPKYSVTEVILYC